MKKKNIMQKTLAIILSFVILATSIPAIVSSAASDELYDPAPYFTDEEYDEETGEMGAQQEGANAWVDEDGNVQVVFPSATAQPTYKSDALGVGGDALSLAFYILELVDLGPIDTMHTETVISTIKVPAANLSGTFVFGTDFTNKIDLASNRYSVTITAVDTENWFSQSIYTIVNDVPEAQVDSDSVVILSDSATSTREIMTFDEDVNSKDDWENKVGNELVYRGVVSQAGTSNAANTEDSAALGFVMYNQPTTTQIYETSWSRQTWDFKGAEEMWVWMDLENVQLEGFSFRLRTNEKLWEEWNDDDETLDQTNRVSGMVYSTKGTAAATYTGEDPYVFIQQADGTWKKQMLEDDGTIDFGGFTGYVRVPLKFMCSEADQYVDISNQEIACGYDYKDGNSVDTGGVESWLTSMTFAGSGQGILVDPAGTSVSDALLIHRRSYLSSSGFASMGTRHRYSWNASGITHTTCGYLDGKPDVDYSKVGYMLAIPLDSSGTDSANDIKTGEVSTDRAYIASGAVQNREGGLKAIQDVWSMGFSIESGTSNTLKEDFYIDNMFFYRTDGGQYTENNVGEGIGTTGNHISDYYDEDVELAKRIFDEIDKYISYPDWADYFEVRYIESLIKGYQEVYEANEAGGGAFLNDANLATIATSLGRDSWNNFITARNACIAAGTYTTANATRNDLVPLIVNTLEKMPKAADIVNVSDTLREAILKIWKAYSMLNLGQLQMLGEAEEQEILELVALLSNTSVDVTDEFVVGSELADNAYVVFNDFENEELGQAAWKLENDNNAYTTDVTGGTGSLANDWRHLKSLVTYSTNGKTNISDRDYYGYQPDDDKDALDDKVLYDAAYGEVTNNGYLNSNAATVNIFNTGTSDGNEGVFHTITMSRDGADSQSFTEMLANNTGLDSLGDFASGNANGNQTFLLSLIFYVDFTELTDEFYLNTRVYTQNSDDENIIAGLDMGSSEDAWRYFILNPATGEWETIYTTNQYALNATGKGTEAINLKGYKGYIRIPLYQIKYKSGLGGAFTSKLDEDVAMLNSIYAIQFSVGGSTSLYGKSYTIDNVGFTYQAYAYSSATTNPTYAEMFNAKSTQGKAFEEQVDAIDLYDESTNATAIANAITAYEALPAKQKELVDQTYQILLEYQNMVNNGTVPTPKVSVDDFNTFVGGLPWEATEAVVDGAADLPYPGFVKDADGNTQVNYSAYGLTKEMAETIIEYYNESYSYYSASEKASLTNLTGFMNAYKAAMRTAQTLENIKVEGEAFNFSSMTTSSTTIDGETVEGLLPIAKHSDVISFWKTEYYPMSYYSKILIDSGEINSLPNISRGTNYYMKNTRTYTIGGETIYGGVITYQNKMQEIHDNAKTKLTAKELFTEDEITQIKYIIEQYDNFLPAYNSVMELFDLKQEIIGLFPVVNTVAPDKTDIMLDENNLSGTSTYKVEYSEILDLDDAGDRYYVTVTSKNGSMINDYGDTLEYKLDISGTATTSATITETGTPHKVDVENNTYTPAAPLNVAVTPSLDAKPTGLRGRVEDTLYIQLYYVDAVKDEGGTITETATAVGGPESVFVSYSMGDEYFVTIPAQFPVEWDSAEKHDVSYTVTTNMNAIAKLTVGVTSDGTGKLTSTAGAATLDYTTENFKEEEFGYNVDDAKPVDTPYVTVSGWDSAPVGEYKTQLTYTVTYDDGSGE